MFTKTLLLSVFSLFILLSFSIESKSQVLITQYYEGSGTNKWIELTNVGNTAINTASPQLKLGLWAASGNGGNIYISGQPSQVLNLNVTIPAKGSVVIGNSSNGNEIPYLSPANAAQIDNNVINFNGNDGIALLDHNNAILDAFGNGINAANKSYYRKLTIAAQNADFLLNEWIEVSPSSVQQAALGNPERLNYHFSNQCTAPNSTAENLVYYTSNANAIGGAFNPALADEYLVLLTTSSTLNALPQNGTVYNNGENIGNAKVINRSANNIFYATGLISSTVYYFHVFLLNTNCIGGPLYNTSAFLTSHKSTTGIAVNQAFYTYYGNLHAHSGYSDGNNDDIQKTPADNFAFAKESMCMDFLGISEHNHTQAGMSLSNWQPGKDQAAAATTSSFLALYGMEFGVISDGGHAIVYGVDSLMGWETNQYHQFVERGNFKRTNGLFEKINQYGENAFVYLAHPEPDDFNAIFKEDYSLSADQAIVGIAIESGPANSNSVGYNNPGSSMAFLNYYKTLLAKGYHVGPTIDHDNHKMTFGRTARTRLAIMAPELKEASILQAMRQMRFYATQDCNAKVNFNIDGQPMGAILLRAGAPQMFIQCETSSPISSVKIMSGTPGSGNYPTELASFNTSTIHFTDESLLNYNERYYYLDIAEVDGTRIITSPIWYTRIDGALASHPIAAFTVTNRPTDVLLKWTTTNENHFTHYIIEKSMDGGRNFAAVGQLPVKGLLNSAATYHFIDSNPYNGVSYYRIKIANVDGRVQTSPQRVINRSTMAITAFSINPNPVKDIANLHIYSSVTTLASIEILDMSGKKLYEKRTMVNTGEQTILLPVMQLAKGSYVIKLVVNNQPLSRLMYKL